MVVKKKNPLLDSVPEQIGQKLGVSPKPETPLSKTPSETKAPSSSSSGSSFNNQPKVIYDKEKGVPTGITLPNGKQFLGISPDEVRFLARKYAAVPGTTDFNAPAPVSSTQPEAPNLTPEQMAQVGKIDQNILNTPDALTNQIQENLQNYAKTGTPLLQQEGKKILPFVPKVTGFIKRQSAFGISGTSLINALSSNRKTREYLQDYTNEESLASIRKNIANANKQINDAISFAEDTENTPENVQIATNIYNDAMLVKQKSMGQLAMIAAGDQREYTDSIKDDLVELERYFNRGGKTSDDAKFLLSLNKPPVKWLPQTEGATQ